MWPHQVYGLNYHVRLCREKKYVLFCLCHFDMWFLTTLDSFWHIYKTTAQAPFAVKRRRAHGVS